MKEHLNQRYWRSKRTTGNADAACSTIQPDHLFLSYYWLHPFSIGAATAGHISKKRKVCWNRWHRDFLNVKVHCLHWRTASMVVLFWNDRNVFASWSSFIPYWRSTPHNMSSRDTSDCTDCQFSIKMHHQRPLPGCHRSKTSHVEGVKERTPRTTTMKGWCLFYTSFAVEGAKEPTPRTTTMKGRCLFYTSFAVLFVCVLTFFNALNRYLFSAANFFSSPVLLSRHRHLQYITFGLLGTILFLTSHNFPIKSWVELLLPEHWPRDVNHITILDNNKRIGSLNPFPEWKKCVPTPSRSMLRVF